MSRNVLCTRLVRQLGYIRVSTASQDAQLQLDALLAAGIQKRDLFADVTSGSRNAIDRPGMRKLLGWDPSRRHLVLSAS